MKKFIVDANLPYFFDLWNSESFIHVFDLNESMTDNEIIHLRIGNMRMKTLHKFLNKPWKDIVNISETHKLTNAYFNRIEEIE